MARDTRTTRQDILAAADELFYAEGLRSVSVDDISAKAGITKMTLYYHFRSKDELIAAYLEARDRPTLERFQQWAGNEGSVAERLERMFRRLGRLAKSPTWKGCGFVANWPMCQAIQRLASLVPTNQMLRNGSAIALRLKAIRIVTLWLVS
jgi:AcrR family transcriptional regulator